MKIEIPKLPQARLYLAAANWGIYALVNNRPTGQEFRFYVIRLLASLRLNSAPRTN
jgi:hypothetical protein